MDVKRYVDFHWALAVVLAPLVLAGLFVLLVGGLGRVRYDSAYFTAAYTERYDTPGAAARALEQALQTSDRELLAELQGLRRPASFDTSPKIIFVMLWEYGDPYISYFYIDMQTHERHMHYFEKVNGRWVVSPPDAYYYLHSGRWLIVFAPVAIVWWLVGAVAILAVWIFRLSARQRATLYGGQGPD